MTARSWLVAFAFLLSGSLTTAQQPLPAPQDRDGDPLPAGAIARLGTTRLREKAQVQLALSPDGRWLACAALRDGTSLWDTTTGKLVRRFPGPRYFFRAVAFTPDGKHLVAPAARNDTTPALFEVATGKLVRRLIPNPDNHVWAVAISPDGKLLATGDPRTKHAIHLWDMATGKLLHTFTEPTAHAVPLVFMPDSKALALGSFKGVRLVDVINHKPLRTMESVPGEVHAVAVSPDGRHLAACIEQREVRLWDAASGRLLHTFAVPLNPKGSNAYGGRGVAFSADARTLFFDGLDQTIRAHEILTGRERWRLEGGGYPLAVSTDGKVLAAGSGSGDGALGVWDLATRTERWPRQAHRLGIRAAAWSPEGKRIATLGVDTTVRVWEADTGKHLAGFPIHADSCEALAWLPDGRTLQTSSYAARQYDAATGRQIAHVPTEMWPGTAMGLSPDGQTLLLHGRRGGVVFWDLRQGREHDRLEAPRPGMRKLATSRDGRLLAIGRTEYETEVWDLVARQSLWDRKTGWASGLAFSADGRFLFGGRNHNIRGLWARRADTGKEAYALCDPNQPVENFALSPDGRLLAVVGWIPGSDRRDVFLIEACSGKERYRRSADAEHVSAVAFAPDGRRLVTACHDTAALAWDLFAATGNIETAWADLAADDGRTAHTAVARLLAAPGPALALLEKRLVPVKPVDPGEVRRLIAGLVDDDAQRRAKAEQGLLALARQAEAAVRRTALEGKPEELRRAAARVLERLEGPITGGALLRQLRAVEVLEHLATPAARRLLERLAGGDPEANLTREAAASVGRLRSNVVPGAGKNGAKGSLDNADLK